MRDEPNINKPIVIIKPVTVNQGEPQRNLDKAWPVTITDDGEESVNPGDVVNRAVRVNIVAGDVVGGTGGTSIADDAPFTPGTSQVTPAGGIYRTSRDSLDDGDVGAIAITQKRAILSCLETPNGDSAMDETNDALRVNMVAGGPSSFVDDAAFTPGTTGVTPVAGTYRSVRDAVNDNDAGAFAMTEKRAILSSIETPNGDSAMDDVNDAVKVNVVAGGSPGAFGTVVVLVDEVAFDLEAAQYLANITFTDPTIIDTINYILTPPFTGTLQISLYDSAAGMTYFLYNNSVGNSLDSISITNMNLPMDTSRTLVFSIGQTSGVSTTLDGFVIGRK